MGKTTVHGTIKKSYAFLANHFNKIRCHLATAALDIHKSRKERLKMSSSGSGKRVCVTGASGFIGSWLVKLLLLRGYTVRATVVEQNDPKHTEHLRALDGADERLHLFEADLLNEGSFDVAVEGCEGVFHSASPVTFTPNDPQADLVDPAVKGTLNVLKSCSRSSSVKRVVMTSSMISVIFTQKPPTPDDIVDETWVSDPAACEKAKMWYGLAKTLAEDAAWKFASAEGIDLVTLHPGLVSGPILQPILNLSVEIVLQLLQGENPLSSNVYRFIDVRDIAFAHIRAFEEPSANGRYCLDGKPVTLAEIQKVLGEFQPDLHIRRSNEDGPIPLEYQISCDKAKSLGIGEFTPVDVTLRETVKSAQEKGFYQRES